MTEASEIIKLKPTDGETLLEKAKGGDPAHVRRFTLFSVWRFIKSDRGIPSKKKTAVFSELCNSVDIRVATNG